ncbi:MAG: endolytic transglycosylase MltG [Candidatus Yanofskybacteria bacterium]|nr:endolytic transglycosylase MltG [Candidatus Yanofskybacteria bacterium]
MNRFLKRYFFSNRYTTTATILAVVALSVLFLLLLLPADLGTSGSGEITLDSGLGLKKIATILKENDFIRSKYVFMLYVMALGQDDNLKAGRYKFDYSYSIPKVVYILSGGFSESDDVSVFIPEGYNIWEVDDRLYEVGLNPRHEFAKKFYLREGYLFPDTYRFKKTATIDDIDQKFEQTFVAKAGLPSSQVRIMASMLEKEAQSKEDMQIIAGILLKRLHIGMKLQIDATVAYGWCLNRSLQNNFAKSCNVTQAPIVFELSKDGPFNTYTRTGFPPRPISNPGITAVEAAKAPKITDYLYYLTTRDGRMVYAKTGAEHEANRKKYLGL